MFHVVQPFLDQKGIGPTDIALDMCNVALWQPLEFVTAGQFFSEVEYGMKKRVAEILG
jgi:hypothetical protein